MPDTNPQPTPTPGTTPATNPEHKPPGYFNAAQLEDIGVSEKVLTAARNHQTELATKGIDSSYMSGLSGFIDAARTKASQTGQAGDASEAATLNASGDERDLVIALQGIQAAAKQKHRMLAEDDDETTNFSTDGYLIGKRLNISRDLLIQNANALILKATADALPGYPAAEIAKVQTALGKFQGAKSAQQSTTELEAGERTQRDRLVKKINSRRMAIQHAADGLWPYTNKDTRHIRKSFQLPQTRPFNG